MELEIIILSEMSKTQKDKYHNVFSHMWNLALKKVRRGLCVCVEGKVTRRNMEGKREYD
jgi:hypothetical protein